VAAVRALEHSLEGVFGKDSVVLVHPTEAMGYVVMWDYELHRPFFASHWATPGEKVTDEVMVDLGQIERGALLNGTVQPVVRVLRRENDTVVPVFAMSLPFPNLGCTFAEQLRPSRQR
jgi:hypothetical protein